MIHLDIMHEVQLEFIQDLIDANRFSPSVVRDYFEITPKQVERLFRELYPNEGMYPFISENPISLDLLIELRDEELKKCEEFGDDSVLEQLGYWHFPVNYHKVFKELEDLPDIQQTVVKWFYTNGSNEKSLSHLPFEAEPFIRSKGLKKYSETIAESCPDAIKKLIVEHTKTEIHQYIGQPRYIDEATRSISSKDRGHGLVVKKRAEEAFKLYQSGMTLKEVGAAMGIDDYTKIQYYIRCYKRDNPEKIDRTQLHAKRNVGAAPTLERKKRCEEAAYLYTECKKSVEEIAKEMSQVKRKSLYTENDRKSAFLPLEVCTLLVEAGVALEKELPKNINDTENFKIALEYNTRTTYSPSPRENIIYKHRGSTPVSLDTANAPLPRKEDAISERNKLRSGILLETKIAELIMRNNVNILKKYQSEIEEMAEQYGCPEKFITAVCNKFGMIPKQNPQIVQNLTTLFEAEREKDWGDVSYG